MEEITCANKPVFQYFLDHFVSSPNKGGYMTRLEVLCKLHGKQGGTIHQYNVLYGVDILSLGNKEFFKLLYAANLKRAHNQYPDKYVWPSEELMNVMERMFAAIDRFSFNKDSDAFKLTCKHLKIPHTYKAIKEYITEKGLSL